MFFGDTVEAIKLVDVNNFSSIGSLPECEIAALPEHCSSDKWQTVFDTLKTKAATFIFENPRGLFIISDAKDCRTPEECLEKKCGTIDIKTLPTVNYFSAFSVLVPEIVWNINTKHKTVLVFVGNSRSCEKYLETKGVPFVISEVNDFKPNTVNIIRKNLGVSFELPDKDLIVYSLHSPKNTNKSPLRTIIDQKNQEEFYLPEIGTLVLHSAHGLGRFLGVKSLQIAENTKKYIVIQYDGGTFVYLPPDRIDELSNYIGPPRRLDRI
jgi:transcription-repair coupling factor (superfamily II helicase)